MKNCKCGKPVEASHYNQCHSCWFVEDPRMKERIKEYLHEMTKTALWHDIIIAEPIESSLYTYDPKYGPKLYWNSERKQYVFLLPDRSVIEP